MKSFRTDLAVEAHEALREEIGQKAEIEGIDVRESGFDGVTVRRVEIQNEAGAKRMGKPVGNYITVEMPGLARDAAGNFALGCRVVARCLRDLLPEGEDKTVLVVGLGNRAVTPDAVGPLAIDSVMVTKHIVELMPEQYAGQFRPVAAFAPGVLGSTGLESQAVIRGLVDQIKPAAVIVIDALAARRLNRLATTFQISDTGIEPGSGVGNHRSAIREKELGVPVIAVGVPTVVDAATLACDVLATVSGDTSDKNYESIQKELSPYEQNLFVTPKDIDDIMAQISKLIGYAINIALQKDLSVEDITAYLS